MIIYYYVLIRKKRTGKKCQVSGMSIISLLVITVKKEPKKRNKET
jgi:hypothetical protein